MAQPARQKYAFEQYVELEQSSSVKHEFLDGAVWAMAGGTPDHAAIAVNVAALLRQQLAGKRCRVFSSDLRVRVVATGLGTYPDVSVVCDRLEYDPADQTRTTVTNPRLVAEVLGPSTADYDRREKLEHYRQVSTLEEIVLVAHDAHRIDVWRRSGEQWTEIITTSGAARLESVSAELPLQDGYADPLARQS